MSAVDESIAVLAKDEERWYRYSGDLYPSSTTVIGRVFGSRFPPEAAAQVDFARKRGNAVHQAIALLCGHRPGFTLEWDSLDDDVLPRVELFQQWRERTGWVSVYVETPFIEKTYGFGATPDHVGFFADKSGGDHPVQWHILEVKPLVAPTAGMQTAAQAMAVRSWLELDYVPGRTVLHLGARELRQVEMAEHRVDRDRFLAALTCFNAGRDLRLFR